MIKYKSLQYFFYIFNYDEITICINKVYCTNLEHELNINNFIEIKLLQKQDPANWFHLIYIKI